MTFTCEYCGWWADVNGVSICGYSGRPTVRHDSCEAWKTTISTNADRIRAMTDEEMAEFLFTKIQDIYEEKVFFRRDMLRWLKQEAE